MDKLSHMQQVVLVIVLLSCLIATIIPPWSTERQLSDRGIVKTEKVYSPLWLPPEGNGIRVQLDVSMLVVEYLLITFVFVTLYIFITNAFFADAAKNKLLHLKVKLRGNVTRVCLVLSLVWMIGWLLLVPFPIESPRLKASKVVANPQNLTHVSDTWFAWYTEKSSSYDKIRSIRYEDLPPEVRNLILSVKDESDPIYLANHRRAYGEAYIYAQMRTDPQLADYIEKQRLTPEELNRVGCILLFDARIPTVTLNRITSGDLFTTVKSISYLVLFMLPTLLSSFIDKKITKVEQYLSIDEKTI